MWDTAMASLLDWKSGATTRPQFLSLVKKSPPVPEEQEFPARVAIK